MDARRVRKYIGLRSAKQKIRVGDLVSYRVRECKSVHRRTVLYAVLKQHSPATFSIMNLQSRKVLQVHVEEIGLTDYYCC